MKVDLVVKKTVDAKFLQVNASVRYWDDASINGERSEDGENVPFKNGDVWNPLIDIDNGVVVDWPKGMTASFCFKVCDAGFYQLLDGSSNLLVEKGGYVPSGLCHGDNGYGDYIIFNVNADGSIHNYKADLDCNDWNDED